MCNNLDEETLYGLKYNWYEKVFCSFDFPWCGCRCVGSWIGGRAMGIAMAGLFSETGLGAVIAGGNGYIVGSYMGNQMGSNLGDSLFNIWYDLYYNTYSSLKEIENYSNSIQNYYQPIW